MEKELETIMERIYKGKLKDYKAKKVNRKYCFDLKIDKISPSLRLKSY
jgi:hypothetical protein